MKLRPADQVVTAVLLFVVVRFFVPCAQAADSGRSPAWPEFHGPNRDNLSPETGLLKKWPDGGPELIWEYSDCGDGYSMESIVDGRVFTAGDFGDDEFLIALDDSGKLIWKAQNGKSWTGAHPGSRTTPTYDAGVLYHLNPTGRLAAFEAVSGREVWSVDLLKTFGGRYGIWALAENVVVDGDRVLCTPGGTHGLVAALDKRTGKTLWANTELDDIAAYCSPLVVTYQGVRQCFTVTHSSVISVNVETGELLWSHPRETRHGQNVTTPVFHDGYLFVASGHLAGGALLKIDPDLQGVTEVWSKKELDNCHGGVLLLDGRLYGSACRQGGKAFFCVDFLTGAVQQMDTTLEKMSLAYADGRIYGITQKGTMYLIHPTGTGIRVISQFQVPKENRDAYFAHPVICGGRLYIRHGNNLYAYNIRAK